MALSPDRGTTHHPTASEAVESFYRFPSSGQLETTEQIRRFELLRLAFFALKLRKLDEDEFDDTEPLRAQYHQSSDPSLISPSAKQLGIIKLEFRRNLLRHVIFQQVLALTRLDAREQALQIIAACRE